MAKIKQEKPLIKVKQKSPEYYQAVGRRKSATARVRVYPVTKDKIMVGDNSLSKDQMIVNDKPIQKYFPGQVFEKMYMNPFKITENLGRFAVTVKVDGSGLSSQLNAVTHGISRALLLVNKEQFKPILKKAGYIIRDPREKERRKAGLAGKARAGKQSPKR